MDSASKVVFLSVAIPAYNEEATIKKVIGDHARVLETLSDRISDWEIVCVDDASVDETPAILRQLSEEIPSLRVVRHETNCGIYESFAHSFREARGTHIYQTAADDQWPAANLRKLLEAMGRGHCDLVIGVRTNRHQIYSAWRRLLSFSFNLIPLVFFRTKTLDANSIKLGRREIFTIPLISKSFFGEIERLIEARRLGYRIGFCPIEFLPRGGGKASGARWKNILTTFRDFGRYLFSKRLCSMEPKPKSGAELRK